MKGRKGFTLIELLVVIAIIAILAAILFPVFAKARKAAQTSNCQSNMKQIGNAMKMYLNDWQDTFPTNRPISSGGSGMPPAGTLQSIDERCRVCDPAPIGGELPLKQYYSINWVEALYSYVEQATKKGDSMSVWKCQAANDMTLFPRTTSSNKDIWRVTTYAFNGCMAEQSEGAVRAASNLMLIRETPDMCEAICRPCPPTTANPVDSGNAPQFSFLEMSDTQLIQAPTPTSNSDIRISMHGTGSIILFADGHVKLIDVGSFPATPTYDSESQQWWNVVNQKNSIAVTP